MKCVKRMKLLDVVVQNMKFFSQGTFDLNYRWELHKGEERAYFEITRDGHNEVIRIPVWRVFTECTESAKTYISDKAQEIMSCYETVFKRQPSIMVHYMKGEKKFDRSEGE